MDKALPTKRGGGGGNNNQGQGQRQTSNRNNSGNGNGGGGGGGPRTKKPRQGSVDGGTTTMSGGGNPSGGRGGGGGRGSGGGRGGGGGGRGGNGRRGNGGRGGSGRGGGGRGGGNRGRSSGQQQQQNRNFVAEPVVADVEMVEATTTTATSNHTPTSTAKLHISDKKFAELPISAESRKAMNDVFKYEFMTQVQAETLPFILKGGDVLAKAKTGTGKTLGFLIPAIEQLVSSKKSGNNVDGQIGCLCISPTRELAQQITTEAQKLITYQKGLRVITVVGGTSIEKDHKALKQNVDILVATPGRLHDHLANYGLAKRMSNMQVLIMDEADQLLDMGFRPDIERILKLLSASKGKRQTLLFSATVPGSVSEIASIALRKEYEYVNTVSEAEEQTHLHVEQEVVVAPPADMTHALASLLFREVSKKGAPHKVIVFFTTARLTGFYAELFNSGHLPNFEKVLEIHSRKSQSYRQKASDKFRKSKSAIMFSSDVSARGMDYPDVTAVIQVGLTERAQYIHRLGRTARAGKNGHGVLLLAPYEERYMVRKELSDLPLQKIDCPVLSESEAPAVDKMLDGVSKDERLTESAEQAYRAWLGYYNGNVKKCGWSKKDLVAEANVWAQDVGLKHQPSLLKKTVGKMGLKGVPGLKIE